MLQSFDNRKWFNPPQFRRYWIAEVLFMVKGVTRRVVLVRCPDIKYFDEAIFMVREDALTGMEPEKIMKEACRAADSYIRLHGEKRRNVWKWVAAGVLAVAVIVIICLL